MKNVRLFKSESEKEQAIHVSEITVSGATLPFYISSEDEGIFYSYWGVEMTYPYAVTLTRDPEEGDECRIYWSREDPGTATTVSGVKSEYIEPWLGYTKKKTIVLSNFGPTNKNPFSYYGEFNVEFEGSIVNPLN